MISHVLVVRPLPVSAVLQHVGHSSDECWATDFSRVDIDDAVADAGLSVGRHEVDVRYGDGLRFEVSR